MANNIKAALQAAEIGGTKRVRKKKAPFGNRVGKQLKAKKHRFSTDKIDGHAAS